MRCDPKSHLESLIQKRFDCINSLISSEASKQSFAFLQLKQGIYEILAWSHYVFHGDRSNHLACFRTIGLQYLRVLLVVATCLKDLWRSWSLWRHKWDLHFSRVKLVWNLPSRFCQRWYADLLSCHQPIKWSFLTNQSTYTWFVSILRKLLNLSGHITLFSSRSSNPCRWNKNIHCQLDQQGQFQPPGLQQRSFHYQFFEWVIVNLSIPRRKIS